MTERTDREPKGRSVHIKGPAANSFIAEGLVDLYGSAAVERCTGPMLDAVNAVLERRAAAAMAEECPHCRDNTHYRVEGDGIAVLRPETLAGCPKFRHELDRAAMAEGGEQ